MRVPDVLARAFWLCPVLSLVLAAAVLVLFGVTLWTAVLTAVVLACPIAAAWTLVAGRLNRGDIKRHVR